MEIYLNSGTLSKMPPEMLARIQELQREYEVNPTRSLFLGWERLWKTQEKVAAFFRARPQDFFFRANVTEALNDFILGIPLEKGSLVGTDLEYGAVWNILRLRAQNDGRELHKLELQAGPDTTADGLVARIMERMPQDARLFLVSHVMTGNGLRVPLKKLAAETRRRGILLAVDGAHGPGSGPLFFDELDDVDFYGGNLHKWMKGPKGTGFGWAPERHQEKMRPLQGTWTAFETPKPFELFAPGHRFAQRMLMSYCLNFHDYFALADLIDWWNKQGPETVWKELDRRRTLLETEGAKLLGWPVISPKAKELRSPLLTFKMPEAVAARGYDFMHGLLREKKVQVSMTPLLGSFALRLSAHIEEPDENLLEGVKRIADYARG